MYWGWSLKTVPAGHQPTPTSLVRIDTDGGRVGSAQTLYDRRKGACSYLLPSLRAATGWILLGAVIPGICAAPLWAQSQPSSSPAATSEAPQPDRDLAPPPKPGSISGTIVDKDGAVVANATVVLTSGAFSSQMLSSGDGTFTFTNVPPGTFELSISSPGFATQKQSGILDAGQDYVTPQVQLVVAANVEVDVTQTREEIAESQIHEEEKQRVFGVVPNYYVTYLPDAVPLNTRQKFELGWKSTVNPVALGIAGVIAGIEQADNAYSGYGQGAQGYAKRLGATYADLVAGTFIGSAILPSVFKQDPRYFYKGTGSRKSRFFYAVASAVICKGDNGHWQTNYSNMLGSLAAGGLSNLYYPASSRNGVGLTFENALIGIGGSAMGAVVEEFFLKRATPHTPNPQSSLN